MRRHLAFCLTLVVVVSSAGLAIGTRPALAFGLYNRGAAIAYADQWTSNTNYGDPPMRNSAYYPDFPNDCTNYVSQVLYAGGYPEYRGGTSNEWWQPYWVGWWVYPHSWTVADDMRRFLQQHPQDFELYGGSPYYLPGGDFFQMDLEGVLYPTHARVLLGMGYDMYYGWYTNLMDQHTNDRKHRYWDYGISPSTQVWPWHVNW
jgi:hypothetical protein